MEKETNLEEEEFTSETTAKWVKKERNEAYVLEGRVRIKTQSSSPNRQPKQRRK